MPEDWELPVDPPAELQALLDYWNGKRAGRTMPLRSEIDPTEFPQLLPGICILELEFDLDRLQRAKFRLAGTDLYEMIGFEVTGKYVDEIVSPKVYGEISSQFDRCIRSRAPVYRRFKWQGSVISEIVYERLFVPLGVTEEQVGFLLGMHAVSTGKGSKFRSGRVSIPLG
ncbi:MAG: PAS domain-containing protein [Alphaproteobacteria bacterium]|nr:PAS domain-containing protein [Alphaproteobacteria bacterium]